MKADKLVGMQFKVPLYSAYKQEYLIKEVNESNLPGHWELILERVPGTYSVPDKIKINVNPVVDFKMMFTLYDIDMGRNLMLNKIIKNRKECDTLGKIKVIFEKLGNNN